MKRVFYILANGFAGVVLVLLLLDPTRPLVPVFVLLALAVACAVVPWSLRREPRRTKRTGAGRPQRKGWAQRVVDAISATSHKQGTAAVVLLAGTRSPAPVRPQPWRDGYPSARTPSSFQVGKRRRPASPT